MDDVKSDSEAVVDLFGNPVEPLKERRGRPRYAKTEENQRDVRLMVAAGWTQAKIASVLGCDEKTLRRHFSRELRDGAATIEFRCLQILMARADQGHTPSVRELMAQIEKGRVTPPAAREPKAEPIGKKAQAEADAAEVPEGWADALPESLH